MTYKVYAKLHPNVFGFDGQDVLVKAEVKADDLNGVCRDIAEFGFLLGGEAGRKLWIAPPQIVIVWADPESAKPPMVN